MPVGTITQAKELALTYQPLLLAEFTFRTGLKLRVASHPLNVTEGGFQFGGQDWLARVTSYDITATQALSESGIDYTPQVTVNMADVNRDIWTNYEEAVGFKGSTLKLTFIFWNVGANEFSTDSLVKFVGVCGTPQVENDSLTVTATSMMNMSQAALPQVRVQKRCPWIFPLTATERSEGATDESSPFYPCGYAPDASSGACGNLNGGSPYTSCNYTYADCLVRLGSAADITKDGSNRPTGRFGGIQWSVPNSFMSRAYVSGKWEDITTTDNEAKYGDLVPLHYGEGWTDPLVLTTDGSSADFTKMHVLLGWGKFSNITTVLVNGTSIPHTYNDTEMSYVSAGVPGATEASKSGWWKCINNGDRNGSVADNIKQTEQPDPYGNLCVIEVVVPRKLADSSSLPRVQVLARGPSIMQYRRITSVTVSGGVATLTFPTANNDFASNDVNFAFEISGNSLGGINGNWTHLTGFTYGPPGTATFSAPGCPDGTGTGGWVRWKGYTDNLAWVLLDCLTWANWRYRDINVESFVDYGDVCRTDIPYKDQFGNTANHQRYTASLIIRQRRSAGEVVRGLRNAGKCLLYLDSTGKLTVKHKGTLASQQPSAVAGSNYNTAIASKTLGGTTANGYVAYDFHEGNIAKKSDNKTPSLVVNQRGLNDAPNRVSFNFQDRDNRYVPDSLTVIDAEDVARIGQELTGQMPIDGINNLDQGRRCAGTWMAENYRGNPRLNAYGEAVGDTGGTRTYEWETTFKVIHLNVGDICRLSYQHLGVSNQLVRVIKIQPTSNFSRVKITALHHNDLWYLDTYGQEDAPLWRPDFRNREMRPSYAWCPHNAQPPVNDSLYARTDWGFGIAQDYDAAADGTAIAKLVITGKLPVNVFSEDTTPPFVGLQGTTASTGGTIAGGRTYWFAVCAKDAAGKLAAPSRIMQVAVPAGTNTNTVTVPVTYWPSDAEGWALFGGGSPNRLCFQSEGTGRPSSITLTAMAVATWGVPDSEFNRLLVRVKRAVHSGVWGQVVTGKTANTVTVAVDPASPFTADQWAGYDLTLLAQTNADAVPCPVWNARVASNTTDGVLTLTGTHPDTTDIHEGDVVVLRFKPTVGVDAGVNYIEDAGIANAYYPDGMTPGAEKGNVLFFIAGTGRGMSVKVKDNTATRYYIEGNWPVTPDSTSRFIVLEPMWQMEIAQETVNNAVADTQVPLILDATNYRNQVIFAQAYTMDGGGDESFPADSPFREIFLFGQTVPTVIATDSLTLTPNAQNVQADATDGPFTITLPPFALWKGLPIAITKVDSTTNEVTWQTSSGDDVVSGFGETSTLTEEGQTIQVTPL